MSFLLRAAAVIGALSYLAANRDDVRPAPRPPTLVTASPLTAAWEGLPPEARDRIAREGAVLVARQVAGAGASSRDTLAEADKRPAWRGTDPR